jgi:hypothetical protein
MAKLSWYSTTKNNNNQYNNSWRGGNQQGALALELLFLLSLSATISLTALPHLAVIQQAGLVRAVAVEIRHCIRLAHIEALETGTEQILNYSQNSLECPEKGKVNVSPKIELSIYSSSKKSLSFSPEGALSPTRIVVKSKTSECLVTLALRGATRLRCQSQKG